MSAQDSNPEGMLAQHNTSLYREEREFERFTLTRTTVAYEDQGMMKNVGEPVYNRYIVWGKIRPVKRFEMDKISGRFDDGSMIMEFRMSMGSNIPQVTDKVELYGTQSRQPRLRYLIKEILPDLSITIGRLLISPIANEGAPEETG